MAPPPKFAAYEAQDDLTSQVGSGKCAPPAILISMRTAICLLAFLLTACPSSSDDDDFGPDCTDGDGDDHCAPSDCDDADEAVHPGAEEVCDGLDNDCDGALSAEELTDADSDGSAACKDCNDDDGTQFPGNKEICDTFDNDCDGDVPAEEVDGDGDGQLACVDCDDTNPAIAPGLPEAECDGVDSNCDGVLDVLEEDGDGDGVTGCEGDCGPDDPAIHPGADEGCNTIDNNCDGNLGTDELDLDSDGYALCAGDCDDGSPGISPGVAEACDGIDTDCNGLVDGVDAQGDPEDADVDGDGILVCLGDCDDSDADIGFGLPELCDGADNDCNGLLDGVDDEGNPEDMDADVDGFTPCTGDCDDDNGTVSPLALEVCDGLDNDCNGLLDGVDDAGGPEDVDADGDGSIACLDCDDADPLAWPGGVDLIDGGDGNCDGVVGADTAALVGWTGPEAAMLDALAVECEARGLEAVQRGFEVGMVNTPLVELGLTFSSDPTGVGAPLVYNTGFDNVLPRTGTRFARSQGPAPALVIEFDVPQTFIAGATQVFGNYLWFDFTVELYWLGTLIDQSGFYVQDNPGTETWALRGVQTTNFVAFDEVRITPPGSQQIVLDDLWICD